MTLCDTGPLVALIDGNDARHEDCRAVLPRLSGPLLTVWPCLAEAMHLLYRAGGYPAQEVLWRYVIDGLLLLHVPSPSEILRMQALMERYRDTPMDLADAALVSTAESLSLNRIFSLDSDFYIYRLAGGETFDVIP